MSISDSGQCDLLDHSPAANRPLLEIGDYRIIREVGRGGMGVVYEAEQISLGRRVALKVLPRHVSNDRLVQERFRREARAAARLHHTNIVPVYEVGEDAGVRFYAMQFIEGLGLDAVITELGRKIGRVRPHSKITAALGGQSHRPRPEHSKNGNDEPTIGAGVEVSAVLRSVLNGRFDRGGPGPEPARSFDPTVAEARTEGLAKATGNACDTPAPESGSAVTQTENASATAGDAKHLMFTLIPSRAQSSSASPSSSSAILPGGSQLSSVESGQRAFFRSLAQIGRQIAGGLAHAHARGIVHRDIKPPNLLLDTEGVVWIADFGLAKGDDEGLTHTGDILGTLRYMAPERFRGEGDARADIYALGLTLYELVTLRSAYDSSDRLKLVEQIKTEEPPRPRMVDPRIPRDLETIILKAIEKDPAARYQSAEALGQDLGRFIADEPIHARRLTVVEKLLRWSRRNRGLAASLAGILLLLSVVAVGGSVAALWYRDSAARFAGLARARDLASKRAETARDQAEASLYLSHITLADSTLRATETGTAGLALSRCVPAAGPLIRADGNGIISPIGSTPSGAGSPGIIRHTSRTSPSALMARRSPLRAAATSITRIPVRRYSPVR